jgi:PPM family protein phosphatase
MRQRLYRALEITGITDIGCSRTKNEDCITWHSGLGIAILTDGMGGANAGEVASRIAAETILKEVTEGMDNMSSSPDGMESGAAYTRASLLLTRAFQKVNGLILSIASDQPECSGMGATTTAALFYNNRLSIGHVGDSRLYRLRGDTLSQLTEDHTVIQELLNGGLYSRKQAEKTINRNIVTRAVGVTPNLKVDIVELGAMPGDIYLICSDGLTDPVSDEEIKTRLETTAELDRCSQGLVDLAKNHGGNDNISVILIRVLKSYPAKFNFIQKITNWFS